MEQLLNTKQTAHLIGWNPGSLRLARSKGASHRLNNQPPYHKADNGRVVYRRHEVLQWMETAHYVKGQRS